MGDGVFRSDLPGIGVRHDVDGSKAGHHASVVTHKDGHVELYVFDHGGKDPSAVLKLSQAQARKLGAVLTGTYFSDA